MRTTERVTIVLTAITAVIMSISAAITYFINDDGSGAVLLLVCASVVWGVTFLQIFQRDREEKL